MHVRRRKRVDMPLLISPELVEPMVRGLVGAIDVDGGATDEQLAVLRAITAHLWQRPDLDPAGLSPLSSAEVASAITTAGARRRFAEVMFTLEMCRHPLTDEQVRVTESYSEALGSSLEEVQIFRTAIDEGVEKAKSDFDRFFNAFAVDRSEIAFRDRARETPKLDKELQERIERFHTLSEGTVGWSLSEFYRTYGFAVPGSEVTPNTYLYFDHDMIHVISGIAPTGPGEIALGAFQMAMDDNPVNTFAFFSPLVVHEAGLGTIDDIVESEHTLARPGAAELLGQEFERGAKTTGDFAFVDHLLLAERPLKDVRREFGVVTPDDPNDGHHIFW